MLVNVTEMSLTLKSRATALLRDTFSIRQIVRSAEARAIPLPDASREGTMPSVARGRFAIIR